MQQVDWFESWFGSPYYRILYQHRDELEAQAFVTALIDYLQPVPGSRMVDIACGEGRFAVQLAEYGNDVTGIDLSLPSIEKAKHEERDNLHFYVHDMRFPFYINYFDYAFNFFTSFGYFRNHRDHLMAAKSFAAALKRDGTLVIDYLNRDNVLASLVPEETIELDGIRFRVQRRLEQQHILKDIRFTDTEGRSRHFVESVAAFGLSDFIEIFRKPGLSLVGTFGDYGLQPFDPQASPRLIMIFKKGDGAATA